MLIRCLAAALLMLAFTSTRAMAANRNGDSEALETVVSKLDEIIRRVESLEQRLSRLEASVSRRPEREYFGLVGPYLIDKYGFLYNQQGNQIGMWGVNGGRL